MQAIKRGRDFISITSLYTETKFGYFVFINHFQDYTVSGMSQALL